MDCVTEACRIAARLLAAGEAPWIGRLRDVRPYGNSTFHAPLIPRRSPHLAWTTHYVACAGRLVHDPLADSPLDVAQYARTVFGRDLPLQEFLGVEETERLLREDDIEQAFRHRIGGS
ncbi:MAG TPA: hypothetical protein VGR02_17540 [Thermoanaerobaculia bacterium]|jgi:hypothetical protein|nr:hypothetical protein [Thermoanaerobaculia bacterium]